MSAGRHDLSGWEPTTNAQGEGASLDLHEHRRGNRSETTPGKPVPKGIWLKDMTIETAATGFVRGLLDGGGLSVVFGEPSCGKTFFATDLSFHVAQGAQWRRLRVRGGPVLYIAAEGGLGLTRRLEALCRDRSVDKAQTPFCLLRACPDLCSSRTDAEAVVVEAQFMAEECEAPCQLIVIDTLARVIAGGDENSPRDMGMLIRNIGHLQTETGAHVMLIHHSGKTSERGPRGHSSVLAAADTVIEVARREDMSVATVTKQKDGETGNAFAFRLERTVIGTDPDGDEISTCIVRHVDGDIAPSPREKLSDKQSIALEALVDAINTGGEAPPPSDHIPPKKSAVPLRVWKDYCSAKHLSSSDTPDAIRKAFDRAKDGLHTKGKIGMWQDWVWLADKADMSGHSGHLQN